MSDVSKLKLLEIANRVPLFKALSVYEKEQIISMKDIVNIIKKGTKFIIFGEQDDKFYILLSGTASVIKKDREIAEIQGGQFVGEVGFICGDPRTASIIAKTDLITFCIDREKFSHLPIRLRDKIKDRVINGLVDRVEHMNDEIEQLTRSVEAFDTEDDNAEAISNETAVAPVKAADESSSEERKPNRSRIKKATW